MDWNNLKKTIFGKLSIVSTITPNDYFVGTRDNGDGTFTDFLYVPPTELVTVNKITVDFSNITTTDNQDDTLQDNWFNGKIIEEIVTNTQTYIRDVNFTQVGDKIILVSGYWYNTQTLRAKL